MAEQPVTGFGGLLRELRAQAGLTQEELAEAAAVSQRAVSDLERGINATARKDTTRLLADALGLAGQARVLFEAAARGRGSAAEALAAASGVGPGASSAVATRALPRDIASFTGRQAELGELMTQLTDVATAGGVVGICAIGGMAGIGKTTLAVHAAHRLVGRFPDGQFFLPLHGHTPGQRPVDPADALHSLLMTSGMPASQIPAGLDARAGCWRDVLAGKKVLLVFDDAAGHQQVRPLLPGTAGSLVLVTSRRRLAALEDAAVISLDTLPPDEAAALLARLAGRPDLSAGDAGAGEITRLCGYLPLAIGILAGQLRHHPSWTTADLAAELAAAQQRLELMHAENMSVAAAIGLSYRDLTGGQRRLFRRLGLHPGPDIDAFAAAALDGSSLAAARRCLEALYDQHLITEPARGRYRLHDLLREHARTLAAADDPAARDLATGRLLDYYLHTALTAGRYMPSLTTAESPAPPGSPPASAPPMSTRQQAAAWLEAERANLHAAAGYAAASGRLSHAMLIPAALAGFLGARDYWDQGLVLNQAALAASRRAGDRTGQALALLLLSYTQGMTENVPAATASANQALGLYRDLDDRAGQAAALTSIGHLSVVIDDYAAAADALRQALELYRDLGHRRGQGDVLNGMGTVHRYTGHYASAAACHEQALELYGDVGDRSGPGDALAGLGAARRLAGDYPAAAATSQQALTLFGDLRDFRSQAYALNELGLVQQLIGDYPAAAASHQQALRLSRDVGNRLGQAETLNCLGELASHTADGRQARDYHAQALAIALEVGTQPDEARALEGIGRSHLQDKHVSEGTACLKQALAIYQRIGSPAARRVQDTLLHPDSWPGNLAPAER